MVLVVGVTAFNGHFQDLANDASEVDSFLFSVAVLIAQVGEEFSVKELVDPCFTVFLLLASGEFLFQPLMAFFCGHDFVFFVVVDFVDVGHDELERVGVSGDGLEDVLVVFNAQGSHEQDHGNGGRTGGADLDHEHAISSLFNGQGFAHTVLLGENLGHFGLLGVPLVDLNGDSVGGEVFHRNEDTLGSVDDEITTGVKRVFTTLSEEFVP